MGLPWHPLPAYISIHPPRVGRDSWQGIVKRFTFPFQSTLPVWGGTCVSWARRITSGISIHPPRVGRDDGDRHSACILRISIHPPRVGRDRNGSTSTRKRRDFNPPSPCGEGLGLVANKIRYHLFQSTLPVWGGTRGWGLALCLSGNFNPPSPCGEGLCSWCWLPC